MNKLTSTLAGLALVAGASIAPALAQGTFSTDPINPPVGTFTTTATSYYFEAPAFYNGTLAGDLTLDGTLTNGTLDGPNRYSTILSFTSTMPGLKDIAEESGVTTLTSVEFGTTPTPTNFHITDTTAFGGITGDRVTVGPLAAVPEASTVLSFGALLALGGLAVLRRKSVAKSAA